MGAVYQWEMSTNGMGSVIAAIHQWEVSTNESYPRVGSALCAIDSESIWARVIIVN